jgi:GT2 family glycosyltransferase
MEVSVIIVSWNTRDILRSCLASVYQNMGSLALEVIVVDNASNDGSAEMVKSEFPNTVLIKNASNAGFGAANNQAIALAHGRYVLLLNSDTVVLDDAIAKAVAFADLNPDAAVTGLRVLNPDRSLQPTCFMFPSVLNLLLSSTGLYKLFPAGRFFGRESMSWWDRASVCKVDVVTGCFMLIRREALDQIGVFDERFFIYGEETDLCYRFKKAGWKNLFFPDAQIIHYGGQSTTQKAPRMLVELRLSILKFFRKHQGYGIYVIACILTALFFLLRIPAWALAAMLAGTQTRASAKIKLRAYLAGLLMALSLGRIQYALD